MVFDTVRNHHLGLMWTTNWYLGIIYSKNIFMFSIFRPLLSCGYFKAIICQPPIIIILYVIIFSTKSNRNILEKYFSVQNILVWGGGKVKYNRSQLVFLRTLYLYFPVKQKAHGRIGVFKYCTCSFIPAVAHLAHHYCGYTDIVA